MCSEMASQRLENIESAPGNGSVSEAAEPQDVVHGRAAHRALRLTEGAGLGSYSVAEKGAYGIEFARCSTETAGSPRGSSLRGASTGYRPAGRRLSAAPRWRPEIGEPIHCPSLRPRARVAGSNPGAAVRPSGLLAPRMLWP